MANSTLEHLIKDFSTDGITRFFRERSPKFAPRKESLDEYNDELFKGGVKLGEIKFDETEELIVCAFSCDNSLSERSGKKAQYEKAKRVLKERISDAGIFVFYDAGGNFRFSLIYTNYLGQKKDWSTFKRFTYFVSKEFTNKTFLQRIGDADFSSLDKIQEAFSVEKVTKEFYENISYWYFWAVKKCVFPKDAEVEENGRNISVIRLITRIIFVWFMRERKLISKELFDKDTINDLLLDTSNDSSTYYQAILQNLFFATLSTKQEERQFRSEIRGQKGFNSDHGNPYVFRFHEYLKNPEKVHGLFVDIPFLNGGLFDCLDDSEKGIYIDGFSETKKNQALVPNELFFGKEAKVDLSSDLGDQQKKCSVQGLFNLLSEFNFTIDENTSDDKDVALDPELLGRVFENLLASFNPETSSTARKATGSYYTPREIVDYMVDESLKGYLGTHLSDVEDIDEKMTILFTTQEENNPFTIKESKRIVNLIENVRVVDPAVGSGAFPMGILNRLVFLLHKVDRNNDFWKQAQIDTANQFTDPKIKQEAIERINEYFKKNPNYGRKLFLIQKCIYGVDIQQIAVEIAKLRFFISLLVDEDVDKSKENWGIEPLPNLDFKIMQGNSLISEFLGFNFEQNTNKSDVQASLDFNDERSQLISKFENKKIEYQNESDKNNKEKLLQEIDDAIIKIFELIVKQQKETYFYSIETIKRKYSVIPNRDERDEIIRKEIEKINIRFSFDLNNAEKQLREYTGKMKSRPFFPWQLYFAEVFAEKEGFDIVLANPPYIGESGHKEIFHEVKKGGLLKYYYGKMDYFYFFFHLALNLGRNKSQISLITTNYYLTATGAKKLRIDFNNRATITKMVNFNELKIFESALGQHNMITFLEKGKSNSNAKIISTNKCGAITQDNLRQILSGYDLETDYFSIIQKELFDGDEYYIRLTPKTTEVEISSSIRSILDRISESNNTLDRIAFIDQGVVSGCDYVARRNEWKISNKQSHIGDGIFVFAINNPRDQEVIATFTKKEKELLKPFFKNSDIHRYWCKTMPEKYLLYIDRSVTNLADYPNVLSHLLKYKDLLTERREVQNGVIQFFQLQWPRNLEIFLGQKIVVPYRSITNTFAYTDKPWFCRSDCYIIRSKTDSVNIKYLLALLNSNLYKCWFNVKGKKKGNILELFQKPLSEIPIKNCHKSEQMPFIEAIEEIITLTNQENFQNDERIKSQVRDYEKQIDLLTYKHYGLSSEEVLIVERGVGNDQKSELDDAEDIIDAGTG